MAAGRLLLLILLIAPPTSGDGERSALVALYRATAGESWVNRDRWLDQGSSHCLWFGVSCDHRFAVTAVGLQTNGLSGTLPVELASLSRLGILNLHTNRLRGTVPAVLGSLTDLRRLSLGVNRLSGTVPAQLGSLTRLTGLGLRENSRLSGTFAVALTGLTSLTGLWVAGTSLSGTLPAEMASLTEIVRLQLFQNRLSGSVPSGLASSLSALMLHSNHLSGSLPSFKNHGSLAVLTLFGNNIGGRLRLPRRAPSLQVLVVHRNRLSCRVEYNSSSYNMSVQLSAQNNYETGALIAPGNRFSEAAKPSWALKSNVRFQWVPENFWREWQVEIWAAVVGILGGAAVIGAVLKAEWWRFFRFQPRGLYERYSCLCLRLLVCLNVCGLVLIPVYVSGAGEFECGRPWLRATLAYLSGDPALEQAAAVLICVVLAVQAVVAVAVRFWSPPELELDDTGLSGSLSWQRWLAVLLLWPAITLVLSLPALLAVLADSVPGDQNTLGLSQTVLVGFEYASAPLLTVIDLVLVPAAARALVGKGAPRRVVGLITLAQFTILLVVPFFTALAFGSDCYGLWIKVWEPCSSGESFNMAYSSPPYTSRGILYPAISVPVITHDEVCDSQPLTYGRCPRYVIESLAKLLVSKLAFGAFVSPVLSVVLCLPWAMKARAWLMKRVLCRSEYAHNLYLDIELAHALLLVTQSIVLGIAVPELPPLACLAVAGRLATVHLVTSRLGVRFKEEHNQPPNWWYLFAAVLLGSGLVLWFFVSNAARVHGEIAVYIGAPVALVVGGVASWAWFYSISTTKRLIESANIGEIKSEPAPGGQECVRFGNEPIEIEFVLEMRK